MKGENGCFAFIFSKRVKWFVSILFLAQVSLHSPPDMSVLFNRSNPFSTQAGIVQGFVQKWAISPGGVHHVCHQLCQTTSRRTSASSRGMVIMASWPVGNCRRRHPASVGGSALGAKRCRMSKKKI